MEGSREEGLLEESKLGEGVRVILAEVIKNGNINWRNKDKTREGEPRGRIPPRWRQPGGRATEKPQKERRGKYPSGGNATGT